MSDLQLALIGAGVAAIAAVWAYNGWQERKHRRAAERLFKGEQTDVLLKDAAPARPAAEKDLAESVSERLEPTLDMTESDLPQEVPLATPPEEAVAPPSQADATVEIPVELSREVSAALADLATLEDVSPADTMADCIVRFSTPAAVQASLVWAAQASWRSGISKPLMWLGCNRGDAAWRYVGDEAVGCYSEWIAALQLADRQGALSDAEIRHFFGGVQQLGSQLGVSVALPDADETLQRAQALDSFCARVDVQFGIYVVEASGGSFAGTKLRGVCEAAGLKLGDDGCFHSYDDNGIEEFLLANIGKDAFSAASIKSLTTQGVSLSIDVPRVADGVAAFNRMITTAQQLSRGLGGVLVDAQRAPLADAMILGIRAKIVELQTQMKAVEIPAGSVRALKLFA